MRISIAIKFRNWTKLSWWQKTRATAFAFAAGAIVITFLLTILLAGLSQTNAIHSLNWAVFSLFPLLVVILIASLVRLQSHINLRSGGSRYEMGSAREKQE